MVVEQMKSVRRRTRTARPSGNPPRHKRYRVNAPRLILSLLLVLLVGEAALAILTSPWFEIKDVVVRGRKLVAPEFVARCTRIPEESNIFTFPTHSIADRLRPNPIIKKVAISRRLPGTLVVRITERSAWSVLSVGGKFYEVDAACIPFRVVASPAPKLPVLSCEIAEAIALGKQIRAPAFHAATNCLQLAIRLGKFSVRKITVDQNNDLCLNVQDGLLIRLGQPLHLEDKLDKARQTIELVPDLEYVDVTCPEAPAFKPKQ